MDNVNSPSHYNYGSIECIDAIKSMLSDAGYIAFCRAQVIKYVWRAPHKNVTYLQDYKKAQYYLNEIIETLERPSS